VKRYSFFLMILLLSSITCCTTDIEDGNDPWVGVPCPESPPFEPHTWPAPEHCDIYDNGRCCTYEWCKWDEGCGWEYDNNFCPLSIDEETLSESR